MAKAAPAKDKFHRLTDLFTPGQQLVVGDMVIWIARLNSFERAEVNKDASAGRAKRLHLLRTDDEEMIRLESAMTDYSREEIIAALVNAAGNENYLKATDDLRTDKDWREKLEVLERGDALLRDQVEIDEEQTKRIGELNVEYMEEVAKRQRLFDEDTRQEVEGLSDEELREKYRDTYRSMLGSTAWVEEAQISEIYYAMRDCNADPGNPTEHATCNHAKRFLTSRGDVRRLPDEIFDDVRRILRELSIPARDAGNSAAPQSSSASSERPAEAEESTPSTPKETSPEPATN